MSITIRQIRTKDFEEILRINSESSPHVALITREDLAHVVAVASFAWIAEDSMQAVGYLLGMTAADDYDGEEFSYFRTACSTPFIYVDQIAVSVVARRTGVASKLHALLLQWSGDLNIRKICCGVNITPPNPSSLAFHRQLGFEQMGELKTSSGPVVAMLCKEVTLSSSGPVLT